MNGNRNDERGALEETAMSGSREYFEAVAGEWDDIRKGLFPDELRETIAGAAELSPGAVAADLGAGTGFLTEALLARGARVIAVDQAEEMLVALGRKLGAQAGDRLELRRGTADALPLPDRSVDRVVANMFLHHVEDPAAALREAARVLRPGGRIVISDLDRHDHEFLLVEQHDRWPGFERSDVEKWLADAGFEAVRITDARATCCGCSESCGETARINVFLAVADLPGAE
jgi:ubiquinone/menaquinone biosynthesis C-methylase UbiE